MDRHTTLEEFREMYEAILDCLTAISNNKGTKWSSKTMMDAFGLLRAISSSAFIAAFQVNRCMFVFAAGLSLSRIVRKMASRPILFVTLVKDFFIDVRQHKDM